MSLNARLTNFISSTKDENNALKIIADFKINENATLHWVLCKFIECNIIREEPQFLRILFNDHIQLVVQIFEWMFMPKIIGKRKKIKSNLDFFPYRCKQFTKENNCFYQFLYLFARDEKLPLSTWFNFLKKQFRDEETLPTALGYFGEVLVPFAKFQFSPSACLSNPMTKMPENSTQEQDSLSIIKVLPQQLISQIIQHCHFESIFQFLKVVILLSLDEPDYYQICRSTGLSILKLPQIPAIFTYFQAGQQQTITNAIQILENFSQALKEVITQMQSTAQLQLRIQYFIEIILQSKIISYIIKEITLSRLCNLPPRKNSQKIDLSKSQQITPISPSSSSSSSLSTDSLYFSQSRIGKSKGFIDTFQDVQQQQLMEIMVRILGVIVQIYVRMPKFIQDRNQDSSSNVNDISTSDRAIEYRILMNNFHQQMQHLLDHLQIMTRLVYSKPDSLVPSVPSRSLLFSSGQKMKTVSFMKYEFIKLLHNCLIMAEFPQNLQSKIQKKKSVKKLKSISFIPFQFQIQKIHLIQIIEKYLCQNRWNNIAHHLLQKICHLLIMCNYEYLRKNIQKDLHTKQASSFLSFLIQNFTQRDYIFLNTFKFTTQGNLQSIYNISKDLAYTLNSTNQLVILLNQFQPWKKFLMNDLKVYEEKAYPDGTRPSQIQQKQQQKQSDIFGLKVDEADSIRKLIQNISSTKKWPTKIAKSRSNPINTSNPFIRNSCQNDPDQGKTPMIRIREPQQNQHNKNQVKTLDEIIKNKVELTLQLEKQPQIQEINVQGISVRKELEKQKQRNSRDQKDKEKDRISTDEENKDKDNTKDKNGQKYTLESVTENTQKEYYGIFKNYSSGPNA